MLSFSSLRDLELHVKGKLQESGVENFSNEARWLVAETLGISFTRLLLESTEAPESQHIEKVLNALTRRCKGEPLSYVLGTADFRGYDFWVDERVLIPRPETERIVEIVGKQLSAESVTRCLEIGVGSGCIAISLLLENPQLSMVATDISEDALKVCHRNALHHGVSDRLELIHGSVTSGVKPEGFDWIVSNPPYIAANDPRVAADVREYEPAVALFADHDGLGVIESILRESPDYLSRTGRIIVEHGEGQGQAVEAEFLKYGFVTVRHLDPFGKSRFVEGWVK